MKSRPVTPYSLYSVGEKSKELADKALNLLNPGRLKLQLPNKSNNKIFCDRKYEQRRNSLRMALAWWEDEDHNPDRDCIDNSKRKIFFEYRKVLLRGEGPLLKVASGSNKHL